MSKTVVGAVLAVVMVATVGCAGSSGRSASSGTGSPSAAAAAPANVNGEWSGFLVGGAPVRMSLKQTGTDVKGNLSVGGRADLDGPVEGIVDGNTLKLRERSGFGSAPLLNVRGDQITGIVGGTTLDLRRAK
jgi:hypothetical protein